jgi:hypothetical protein
MTHILKRCLKHCLSLVNSPPDDGLIDGDGPPRVGVDAHVGVQTNQLYCSVYLGARAAQVSVVF